MSKGRTSLPSRRSRQQQALQSARVAQIARPAQGQLSPSAAPAPPASNTTTTLALAKPTNAPSRAETQGGAPQKEAPRSSVPQPSASQPTTPTTKNFCFSVSLFTHAPEIGIVCALLVIAICIAARLLSKGVVDESLLGVVIVAGAAGYTLPQSFLLLVASFCPNHIEQIADLRQMLAVTAVGLFFVGVLTCIGAFHKAAQASEIARPATSVTLAAPATPASSASASTSAPWAPMPAPSSFSSFPL